MKKIVILTLILVFSISLTGLAQNNSSDNKSVDLWYSSVEGLVKVTVPIPDGINNLPFYALESLFEQKGIKDGLWSEIPKDTQLNYLKKKGDLVVVDLNQKFIDGIGNNHNVYSIVTAIENTLFQFNDINAFRITVNGENINQIRDYDLDREIKRFVPSKNYDNTSSSVDGLVNILGEINPDPVIYLDAGHGGTDPGAIATDGTFEKDINLAVALKLRDYLVAQGASVIMSRTTDITKDMNTRISEAENNNVDFIITIHNDTSSDTSVRGYRVYYPKDHDVNTSTDLAWKIHNRLPYTNIPSFNTPIYHDGIGLLIWTHRPAVLVEAGFLSNSQDLAILKSTSGQDSIAFNIYVGIRQWWYGY